MQDCDGDSKGEDVEAKKQGKKNKRKNKNKKKDTQSECSEFTDDQSAKRLNNNFLDSPETKSTVSQFEDG